MFEFVRRPGAKGRSMVISDHIKVTVLEVRGERLQLQISRGPETTICPMAAWAQLRPAPGVEKAAREEDEASSI